MSGAEAIAGGTGDVAGTLDNLIDAGSTGGIELNATTGTFTVSALTVTTTGGTGVALTNAGTVNFADTITVTTTGATGVALTNAGTVNFPSTAIITITTAGAKALDATGATTSFGTGSVIDDDHCHRLGVPVASASPPPPAR